MRVSGSGCRKSTSRTSRPRAGDSARVLSGGTAKSAPGSPILTSGPVAGAVVMLASPLMFLGQGTVGKGKLDVERRRAVGAAQVEFFNRLQAVDRTVAHRHFQFGGLLGLVRTIARLVGVQQPAVRQLGKVRPDRADEFRTG